MQTTFQCPTDDQHGRKSRMSEGVEALVGCGAQFQATPDDEGFVDCPACGMFFRPRDRDVLVFVPAEVSR